MIDRTLACSFNRPRAMLPGWQVVRGLAWATFGVLLAAGGAGGCAAIPLATLGAIAGAAGSAASTGQEIYGMGKLDTAELQRGLDVSLAARKAALEMGLDRRPNPKEMNAKDPFVEELEFVDRKGERVTVRIDQRAERLVLLRIDVGIFGSEPFAHLFLNRLRTHLPGSAMHGARSAG